MLTKDAQVIRELAKRYAEVCADEEQDRRRKLWRDHNSFKRTRPPIYVRWLAAWHEAEESKLTCVDPLFRRHEEHLRQMLFQATINDDHVLEPWLTVTARYVLPKGGHWGMSAVWERPAEAGGAGRWRPPIVAPEDAERLAKPSHAIDEEATRIDEERIREAVDGVLDVVVSRAPFYKVWTGDLSTDLAYLRGLDQMMVDMLDRPEWLQKLVHSMAQGVLATHEQADAAGDWRLCDHENQAMPYALELPDPSPSTEPVPQNRLWGYMAAQEFALVSPQMHWDFVMQYQLPIMSRFGLVAYGCCENLSRKIGYLRRIPNLRRIAVAPSADIKVSAEAIGTDYVISWRPNPAEMVCCGFDEDYVAKAVARAADVFRGLTWDITLKDVQTVQGDTSRLRRWVEVVKAAAGD